MTGRGIHFLDAKGPTGVAIYAIGDIHGRLDLLTRMHAKIAADRARRAAADWRIIHLGDYVDRGPESNGVLEFLVNARRADNRIMALAGNHDLGMLDFLSTGEPGSLFARYGGVQTARSYGVELDLDSPKRARIAHRRLVDAVPASHAEFIRSLKFAESMGDFFFCHAGIRPGVALEAQDPSDLIWIRQEFHSHPGLYEKIIVHGHTPSPEAEVLANRVNVDTGAYATGKLTALVVDGIDKQTLTVDDLGD